MLIHFMTNKLSKDCVFLNLSHDSFLTGTEVFLYTEVTVNGLVAVTF